MKLNLLDHKELKSFPSGSGIEYFDDKIYIVGDDGADILVTNRRWKTQDEIKLTGNKASRKAERPKADLEAAAIIESDKKNLLMVMYSGNDDLKKKAVLVDLKTNAVSEFDYRVFYERLKNSGISDLNIEGAVQVHEFLIFCNRANPSNPSNQLIITSPDFFRRQKDAPIELLDIDLSDYDGTIAVSGLTYSYEHDQLIFTTTTEDEATGSGSTANVRSYLGIIENGYRKIWRHKIKVNELIDLPGTHEEFRGHKVESVCIQSENNRSIKMHMIADNTKGESFLYKVRLRF